MVPRKSTIPAIVNKALDETKGSGVRKLHINLRVQYLGISRGSVKDTRPTAKAVPDRQQVDLVDMGKWRIKNVEVKQT